jgi:integrase
VAQVIARPARPSWRSGRRPLGHRQRNHPVRRSEAVALHIQTHEIGRDQPLFTTAAGTPISRDTFRTRVWLPAVKASGVDFAVRMHDLRHAHASWLLAEGSDLKSVMERMGHAQIQTNQKYLHALPEADRKNLDALARAPPATSTISMTRGDRRDLTHRGDRGCTTRTTKH